MNANIEILRTMYPDYACPDNGDITVIAQTFVKEGKVVKINVRYGHTKYTGNNG